MSVSLNFNRRGATLPLSIIVLSLMAVAVAITYTRITAERHIGSDARARLGAFAVAQSGINRWLSTVNGKPAGAVGVVQTTNYNDLPGGTARVDVVMLRESTTTLLPAVYVITSRGTYTGGRRWDARTPPAERSVATYALWTPTPFDLNGAFTSLSGINKAGNSGALDGNDHCVGTNLPAIPGAAVPNGTYTGDQTPINGNPNDAPSEMGTPGPGGTAKDEVDIDWAGIVGGAVLPPNFTWPAWPTAAQFANWPVVKVNGDLDPLPSSGKGILIVTGDLRINGAVPPRQWDGLVLVGGTVTFNGNSNIFGALITGLNVKLGNVVPTNDVANGTKVIQYDSCNLNRALGKIGSVQRVRNGWTDTWSSYQ
jgi:hypothetical protein